MRFMLIILLLTAIAFGGCKSPSSTTSNGNGNSNNNQVLSIKAPEPIKPEQPADPNFKPCNPYFPLVPGSVAKYVVNYSSGIVGDLTVVVDTAEENGQKIFLQRSQLIDRSGGMQIIQTITRKLRCDGDRVMIISERTESNIAGQQSSADFDYRENSVIMTDPKSMLIEGTAWTHGFRPTYHSPGNPPAKSEESTIIAFEVGSPQHVTTAIGTFKAIPVARRVSDNLTVDQYVAGLGLVKRQSKEGSSWELKEYSGLTPED